MSKGLLAYCLLWLSFAHAAEPSEKVSQIRVFIPDRSALDRIWSAGIDFEGATGKIGGPMEFVAGAHELDQLRQSGVAFEVVVDDLGVHYAAQFALGPVNALGFGYGSMGGFYTYVEVQQQLDSMRTLYPSLITAKDSIGSTIQGRTIWAAKISDSPELDEPGEPEVLYTALHHAREPQGMMTLLYYMWWLLENYSSNAESAYLVNSREMWFIPVINPDGYVHNQTTNPSGGGMWRKNRRDNGAGIYGVDLNRNYGPTYMWNSTNGGSSTTPNSDTYRGQSAFSEPETQTIDAFMRSHEFKTAFNYHTYGNYIIYPYGYLSKENSDSLVYRDWTYKMTYTGRYTNGTDQQTVNYSTRGNSDDYMFGDTTKPSTFTMTPEVGTTGFWPSSGLIFPLAIENLPSNKFLAYFAGHFPEIRHHAVLEPDSQGTLTRGDNFVFRLSFKNMGLGEASNLTVALSTDVDWVGFPSPSSLFASVPPLSSVQTDFNGSITGAAPGSSSFKVYVTFSDPAGFEKRDTVTLISGNATLLFSDSASAGTSQWTTGTGWGITADAHTSPGAFTDSPSGNYNANANNALTMVGNVNLAGYTNAELRFWTRWALEPTWDFALVEISTNNGSTWDYVRTSYSRPGSARSGSQQPAGSWGYDGYTPGLTWAEQSVDLSAYIGQSAKLRFRLRADGSEQRDGFLVDDVRVFGYAVSAPLTPALSLPSNGSSDVSFPVVLRWNRAQDAVSYRMQVSTDSSFAVLIENDSTLTDTLKSLSSLQGLTQYHWRVRAKNASGSSGFSDSWMFATSVAPPAAPALVSPANNAVSQPLSVSFVWNATPGASGYHLQIASDTSFSVLAVNDSTLTDTTGLSGVLAHSTTYYWRVRGLNTGGVGSFSARRSFATIPAAPNAPVLVLPVDNATSQPTILALRWNNLAGADNYWLQVSSDSLFAALAFADSSNADTSTLVSVLEPASQYYWRVLGENPGGTGPWSVARRFFTTSDASRLYSLQEGWNLLSLPLDVIDPSADAVFPSAISNAFTFVSAAGYIPSDSLLPGVGYWLKFAANQDEVITGAVRDGDSIHVVAGWNLIGGLSDSVVVSSIEQIPPGIIDSPFYEFQTVYIGVNTLEPARGYWVKASQAGVLVLSSSLLNVGRSQFK